VCKTFETASLLVSLAFALCFSKFLAFHAGFEEDCACSPHSTVNASCCRFMKILICFSSVCLRLGAAHSTPSFLQYAPSTPPLFRRLKRRDVNVIIIACSRSLFVGTQIVRLFFILSQSFYFLSCGDLVVGCG